MSKIIVKKESLLIRRETLVKILLAIIMLLLVVSMMAGVQRETVFAKERTAAERTDKEVWMNQGDRNPHSAAHFSRYAFRAVSPLSLIDPGTNDFAGLAVWMEAHYQDPAVFRRAEDGGELSRYSQLTPAFLLITIAPLLIFLMLHGSIAGEREDGTLRQMLASGVKPGELFVGKLVAGLRLTLTVFTILFVAIAVFSVVTNPAGFSTDSGLRLLAMFSVFVVYLSICVALAIGISSLLGTRQTAFLALAGVWVIALVLTPRFASGVSTTLYAQPDARVVSKDLSAASYVYYSDESKQKQIESDLLKEHDVTSVEELPFNYGAYTLQVSEELSIPAFEKVYSDLDQQYLRQENTMRIMSLLTPVISVTNLSRGLAGTDRYHQSSFTTAAEMHRRKMIKMLNDDYMLNAGDAGSAYTADADLWQQFEDFEYQPLRLSAVWSKYLIDMLILLSWLLAACVFAYFAMGRAIRREVPTS